MIGLLMRFGAARWIMKLLTDRRIPIRAKLIIVAAFIYLISPFDLVPDIVPISGWIDDIVVTLVAGVLFMLMVPRDVLMEHMGRRASTRPRDGKVIDGEYKILDDDRKDENNGNGGSKAA